MQYSGFIQSVERDVRRVGTELVAAKADAHRLAAAVGEALTLVIMCAWDSVPTLCGWSPFQAEFWQTDSLCIALPPG